jgi:hypothetical protein
MASLFATVHLPLVLSLFLLLFPILAIAQDSSGAIRDHNSNVRFVQRTFVDATGIGDTEAIPSQGAGIRIRLLGVYCQSALAVSLKLKSAGANLISGTFAVATNGTLSMPFNPHGWMQTNPGEALTLNQSLGVNTGCQFVWIQA